MGQNNSWRALYQRQRGCILRHLPLDILNNIAILILPIPDLWNLQMQRWKKFAITLIFVLGSL